MSGELASLMERIQPAGSLYWYEWLAGAAVIVIIAVVFVGLNLHWE